MGGRGDSYDNAMAESFNGLYKTELIFHEGPWKGVEEVEWATLSYVDWFNHRRIHNEIGKIPQQSSRPTATTTVRVQLSGPRRGRRGRPGSWEGSGEGPRQDAGTDPHAGDPRVVASARRRRLPAHRRND